MLLKRGVFRGLLAAGALFGATSGTFPPVEPPAPDTGSLSSRASAFAPGATQAHEEAERAMIERQNQVILALVMSAVNSRILE